MSEHKEPSPFELWRQAGGDPARYRALLREHGHLIPLAPGEKAEPLPCGWPQRRASSATWDDLLADPYEQFDPDGLMLAAVSGADNPAPTTGAPYEHHFPEGCICYLREDPDWGEVYTRPFGRACPAHDCTCDIALPCRAHSPGGVR